MRRSPIDAALKLLAARSRTEAELRRALETKGYAPAETLAALARVRELGYLDDGEVASARARSLLERGASPRSAVRRLEEQGIDGAQARRAVDGQTGEGGEDALLRRALERRLKGRAAFGAGSAGDRQPQAAESIDLAEKKRLFRSLVQKGFSPAAVARELGIPGDFDDDHET